MSYTKLPIGIQDFEEIIKNGYVYVDKTALIYDLVTRGKPYFLSRPRRFGKSLLVSTLAALFSAKQHLFKGLWIEHANWDWIEYPIIRLDMSIVHNATVQALESSLIVEVKKIAAKYGHDTEGVSASDHLSNLIDKLSTRQQVVVLVDEYDKPILDQLESPTIAHQNREILKQFYNVLKARDADLKFVFLTGVTKFSKVSVFSGLNNLKDISLNTAYCTLLGLTEREILSCFSQDLQRIADKQGERLDALERMLKKWYNGYCFSQSPDAERVYNPHSVLNFLDTATFNNYWFSTATPTFALKLIREQKYPIADLETGVVMGDSIDESYEANAIDLVTLLYQTGYLTIERFDPTSRRYFLKYPNEEVRRSFTNHLLREMTALSASRIEPQMYQIEKALKDLEFKTFFDELNLLLASIPYALQIAEEAYYHSLIYAILRCLNFEVASEVMTARGRIDMVLIFQNKVFVFEFKINSSAMNAIMQIKQNQYFQREIRSDREVFLIGVNFNTKTRTLDDWILEQV